MTMWLPDIENRQGPRYLAISDALADDIYAGNIGLGDRLPTHRELAHQLGVTVGTISRAYREAERRGLTYGEVGRGTFVKNPAESSSDSINYFQKKPDQSTEIDFCLNMPATGNRAEVFSHTLAEIARAPNLNDFLGYETNGGMAAHRKAIANWLAQYELVNNPDQIIMTNGAQHALAIALMALTDPGDLIAAENYTYPAIQGLTQQLGLKLVGLEMDEAGIIPDAFEKLCHHRPPKILYCLPTLQNPTTTVMPEQRRREIAALAKRYNVLIMDDDVNGYLVADAPPPLSVFAPEQAFFISSASKFLAPGLRVGFIHCPAPYADKIRTTLQLTSWMATPLMGEIVRRWLEDGTAEKFVDWHRREAQFLQGLAQAELGAADYCAAPVSYHLWLKMPAHWRAEKFVARVAEAGVRILPASTFAVGNTGSEEAARLCLGAPDSREKVKAGVKIIAAALAETQQAPALVI